MFTYDHSRYHPLTNRRIRYLINILLMPALLQFAVKIAGLTERVKIMTSVMVLPLHDMRILAGQLVCADIFTAGRLLLGVAAARLHWK